MTQQEFKKSIADELAACGFEKLRQSFHKAAPEVACLIGIQKSRFSDDYYVNAGFLIRSLHPDLASCDFSDGDVRTRMVPKPGGEDPELFEIENIDAEKVRAVVREFIRTLVEPSLSLEGLRNMLRARPVFLYQTTVAAKRALALE